MKIGIIIGQPTQFEGPLFQYIAKKNMADLEVIYYNSNTAQNIYDPELNIDLNWGIDLLSGYTSYFIPAKNKFAWLKERLIKAQYDLLIINGYNGIILWYAMYLGKVYAKHLALRLDTVEFISKSFANKLFKRFLFALFKKIFNHFFAIGSLTVKYLKKMKIEAKKISIFSYVTDNAFFQINSNLSIEEKNELNHKLKVPLASKVILSVAKFSEREAPWDLLKAVSFANRQGWHLLLVGDGPLRKQLEDYVKFNLNNRVTFAGYIKYPELPKFYSIADLFVHTSINEPWGVSVQEAMACGLPVITSTTVGSSFDLIVDGKNGYTYKAGDISDLAKKIEFILKMDKTLINRVNEGILNEWNYEKTTVNILKVV